MRNIYTLSDPRTPENIRYIGITKKELKKRFSVHMSPSNLLSNNHKNNWINSLLKENIKPIITLLEIVNDDKYEEKERYWIKYYRDLGFNLTNSTDGGEGMLNPCEETRKKLSDASKGENNPNYGVKRTKKLNDKINNVRVMRHSDETKKIISEKGKGRRHTEETKKIIAEKNKGKIVSEETRHKLSTLNKGKIVSEETRLNLSIACEGEKNGFYGKTHSEETKKIISEKNKGRIMSEDTKQKLSLSHSGEKNSFYGRKHTEETKLKMKETRRLKKELKDNNINDEFISDDY